MKFATPYGEQYYFSSGSGPSESKKEKNNGLKKNVSDRILVDKLLLGRSKTTLQEIHEAAKEFHSSVKALPDMAPVNGLYVGGGLDDPMVQKLCSSLNGSVLFQQAWMLLNGVVNPFWSVGGPVLAWVALTSLYQWAQGACVNIPWVKAELCTLFFRTPSLSSLSDFAWVTCALAFALYALQSWMAISSAAETWGHLMVLQEVSDPYLRLQKGYQKLVALTYSGRRVQDAEEEAGCCPWAETAARLWRVHEMLEQRIWQKNVGRIDACVTRALDRLARSEPDKQSGSTNE
jgi:hypothetical protein